MSWRKRLRVESVEALVELARDRSRAGRENLASAVGDLFGDENSDLFGDEDGALTKSEQIIMHDILGRLVKDVEISVRAKLAQKLADVDKVPHELIVVLANDECTVALPILQRSAVLHDHDLIEIIRHRTMEHRLAVAMRAAISESVSDALVETDEPEVTETLLRNKGGAISSASMTQLVEQSETIESYRGPLLDRRELAPAMAKKMYWWVSAALRQIIFERYTLSPVDFDDAMEGAVLDALHEVGHATATESARLDTPAPLDESPQYRLIDVLRNGEIAEFQKLMCAAVGLPLPEIRRIMFEPGGENLAIACRAAELVPSVFAAIYRLIRSVIDHDEGMPRGELTRITSLYLDIDPSHARIVLRQWRRNPDYLAAIAQIGDVSPRSAVKFRANRRRSRWCRRLNSLHADSANHRYDAPVFVGPGASVP